MVVFTEGEEQMPTNGASRATVSASSRLSGMAEGTEEEEEEEEIR
jgi:hypothetical protein